MSCARYLGNFFIFGNVLLGTVYILFEYFNFFSTFCMVDKNNDCIAVTVYNLANGQGVIIGDVVAIAVPFFRNIDFEFKNMVIHL